MNNPERGRLALSRLYSPDNDATVMTGKSEQVLKTLPSGCAKLVLTSPPYNVGKAYEKRRSLSDYTELLSTVISQSAALLTMGGSLCVQVGSTFDDRGRLVLIDKLVDNIIDQLRPRTDLVLRNRIIWHFNHGLHTTNRFSGRYETIMWYTKGDDYDFHLDDVRVPQKYPGKRAYKGPNAGKLSGHPLGKNPSDFWVSETDVWDIPNVKSKHVEKLDHPCQFPLDLAARLILSLTRPDELVVDPFGGVGTTAAAAIHLGRRALTIDALPQYSELARKRIKAAWRGRLPRRPSAPPMAVPPGAAVAQLPDSFARLREQTSLAPDISTAG